MIIYLILNLINHKMYIGKSLKDDITSRKSRPYFHLNGKQSHSKLVFAASKKYGIDNFLVLVIHKENCSKEKLADLEKYYIQHFNTISPNGYNISSGGDGGNTGKRTEESKKKMSESNKGKHSGPKSEEHKRKISESNLVAQNTPEHKNKMAEILHSSDYIEKQRKAQLIAQNRPGSKKKRVETLKITCSTPEARKRLAKTGMYANHINHHFNKGILNFDCQHCIEQVMKEHS
jgi:group I intron endonuclease